MIPWLDLNALKYLEIAGGEKDSFAETREFALDGSGWAKVLETIILGDNVLTALKNICLESIEWSRLSYRFIWTEKVSYRQKCMSWLYWLCDE